MKRKIIKIDEELCTGCGVCIPNCPEGALQVIDGKARLVSDLFCDGLGACIGDCPEGAISTEIREAQAYNEKTVMINIVKAGKNTIIAHLTHLRNHNEEELYNQALEYLNENEVEIPFGFETYKMEKTPSESCACDQNSNGTTESLLGGCPGMKSFDFELDPKEKNISAEAKETDSQKLIAPIFNSGSQLRNWPIQINLAPLQASYFNDSNLIFVADCAALAFPNIHSVFLKGRTVLMGCPKLDNGQHYIEKLTEIFKLNDIRTIHILMMEVPCCNGMSYIIKTALKLSGKQGIVPITQNIIKTDGSIKS